ncbi:MAG TPA: hypothetical protein VFA07_00125 [Chthonomonadaceae bacterium]|nr:hypothetical protein [Chthonomonadaceae bacterium]
MAFPIHVGFMRENDLREFTDRLLPRLPGCRVLDEDLPETDKEEVEQTIYRVRLAVSSPTGARELCQQLMSFLSHHKGSGVFLEWTGHDGLPQNVPLNSDMPRNAEIASVRLAASVKAHNDAEKAAAKSQEAPPEA